MNGLAFPSKLLNGNGCPKCNDRNKTSFSEQAIYFYIKSKYNDAINRYKLNDSRLELDIYIPSIAIAIEYDGVYWHKSDKVKKLEKLKHNICIERGITLYRIREGEDNFSEDADIVIYREKPYNYKTLDDSY